MMERVACDANFDCITGELSSPATQHVCIDKLGHTPVAVLPINEFEFEGHYPFLSVESPRHIVLTRKTLSPDK